MTKIKMNKREMMVEAHQMAKQMIGDYSARLALALRTLWASVKKGATKIMKAIENLTGSEKQIAWAKEIIAQNLKDLQREMDYYKGRTDGVFTDYADKLEKAINELGESNCTAKWWIEHRNLANAYMQKAKTQVQAARDKAAQS